MKVVSVGEDRMSPGERHRAEARLRRRVRGWLRELDIRPPLDVEELGRRFGEQRGRPILFKPYDLPVPGPFAVTIVDPHAAVVLYPENAGQIRQTHCKAHELGHLLAGHQPELVQGLHVHRRTKYDSHQEWEAETIASIILEWAMVLTTVAIGSGAEAKRVERVFTLHRRGWW